MIKRVFRKLVGGKKKTLSQLERLRNSGNFIHGTNCKFEGLNIASIGYQKDYLNVKVGNNCYLCCNIMLQTETAEVIIGDGVFIGPGTTLFCRDRIVIDNDIMISWGCTLIDTNAHSLHSRERAADVSESMQGPNYKNWSVVKGAPIHVKDKCWVGFNSIILKGVTLSEGTIVGAGSVVSKTTEEYSIYGGNPATFIKKTD